MKVNLYKQLVKQCGSEPHLLRFFSELNTTADAIVHMGKQTKKMRKSVHPDTAHIEEMESCRLFILLSFLKCYEDEIKKLNKKFIWTEEDMQQLFENIH